MDGDTLELPAVFRGSLLVNGQTSAAVRMQAGLKAIVSAGKTSREVCVLVNMYACV